MINCDHKHEGMTSSQEATKSGGEIDLQILWPVHP